MYHTNLSIKSLSKVTSIDFKTLLIGSIYRIIKCLTSISIIFSSIFGTIATFLGIDILPYYTSTPYDFSNDPSRKVLSKLDPFWFEITSSIEL